MKDRIIDTSSSVFDVDTSADDPFVIPLPSSLENNAREIEIIKGEEAGWNFYKGSSDGKMQVAIDLATAWACYTQARVAHGAKFKDVWDEGEWVAHKSFMDSRIHYTALGLLLRHWKRRKQLDAASQKRLKS